MRKAVIGWLAATAVIAAGAPAAAQPNATPDQGRGQQSQEPIGFPFGANVPGSKPGGGPGTDTASEGSAGTGGEGSSARGAARGAAPRAGRAESGARVKGATRRGAVAARGDRNVRAGEGQRGDNWDGVPPENWGGPPRVGPGSAFGFGGPWQAPYANYGYGWGGPYAYAGPRCQIVRMRSTLPNGRIVWRNVERC